MSEHPPFHAVIVAAGRGQRSGLDLPKQYADLGGKAVLRWSAEALIAHPACVGLTVVVADDAGARTLAADALRGLAATIVDGGAERQQSVAAGLAALGTEADLVLVHDAARPGLGGAEIDRLLAAFADADVQGAVPTLALADTLARGAGDLGEPVDRSALVRIQTPQAFRLHALRSALAAWDKGPATDETQVVRAAGGRIVTVTGSRRLDKITHPGDLEHMAKLLTSSGDRALPAWRVAVGTGFDVHRLADGDGLWLGGVWIAHNRRLEGHSDADVLLHALTDALLGTIADGDIGSHFSPSDPQWRGAASDQFLLHAAALVRAAGGVIDHVDCTIICEAPKVGPHRAAIRARIAQLLNVGLDQVSVKATTTERLGFTGRGEGIAAQACATLLLPRVITNDG